MFDKKKVRMAVDVVSDAEVYVNIRNLLRKRHSSADELAEYLSVSPEDVRGWLGGETEIPPSYLVPTAEFLDVSVTALLMPDTRHFDDEGFPLDARPMWRVREFLRMSQEVLADDRFRRLCAAYGDVVQENMAIRLTRDAKAANAAASKGEEPVTGGAASLMDMDDDAYNALMDHVDAVCAEVFEDKPELKFDFIALYEKLMGVCGSTGFAAGVLRKQAQMSHVNENGALYLAPESDWTIPLIASGYAPSDFDDTDDVLVDDEAPVREDFPIEDDFDAVDEGIASVPTVDAVLPRCE